MTNKKTTKALAAVLLSMAAAASTVSAALIPIMENNTSIALTGPDSFGIPTPAGSEMISNYSSSQTKNGKTYIYSGTLTSYSYFDLTGTTFIYRLQANPKPANVPATTTYSSITSVNVNGWDSLSDAVAVSYNGVKPNSVKWNYGTISFDFQQPSIAAGGSTTLIVHIDGKYVPTEGLVSVNAYGALNIDSISPVPVPEPATYVAGLGALALFGFTAFPKRKLVK